MWRLLSAALSVHPPHQDPRVEGHCECEMALEQHSKGLRFATWLLILV